MTGSWDVFKGVAQAIAILILILGGGDARRIGGGPETITGEAAAAGHDQFELVAGYLQGAGDAAAERTGEVGQDGV